MLIEDYINLKEAVHSMEEDTMSFEELEKLKEAEIEIDSTAFEVNEGRCKACSGRLIKIVENRSVLDGAITFHIIKLKCLTCGKEYLDLDQAEKYDFLLLLEKATKQPLNILSRKITS